MGAFIHHSPLIIHLLQLFFNDKLFAINRNLPIFAPAGLARPAPAELPQDRKVARVGGCSGAM